MTELWYIDNAGNETVTSITASSTIVSSSTITGTSFAATSVGSTFGTGSGGVAGYFSSNLDGQFPSTNSGLAIGSNKSGGSSEVDFINSNTASLVSFNFYQQTGASAVTLLASILPTSGIKIPISLAAATSGDGLTLTNDTAATVGNQSYSPRLRLTGQGWKTDATSASQTVDWIIENEPLQGAANPSTRLYFKSQINGGGYNTRMYLYDNVAGTQSTLSLDNSSSSQIELNVGGNTALFLYADGAQLLLGSQFNLPLKFYTNNTEKARLSGSVFSPGADDGTALGSTSLQWSDAFIASGGQIVFNNDVSLTHSTDLLTVAGGSIKLAAGTTGFAPLQLQAGTNTTTAVDGAVEFDGQALFFSPDASDRRIIPTVAITRLHADNTLSDSTSLQKIFNASASGALTLPVGSYIFECVVGIDTMSATSGNAALSIIGAGGATVTNTIQVVIGIDGAQATAGAASGASWSVTNDAPAANNSVVTATTATAMAVMWKGSFEVTGAGTIIPSVDLITGGVTPAVKIGSYFMCWRMGAATDVTQGNWS
jgi:hypothetical protein